MLASATRSKEPDSGTHPMTSCRMRKVRSLRRGSMLSACHPLSGIFSRWSAAGVARAPRLRKNNPPLKMPRVERLRLGGAQPDRGHVHGGETRQLHRGAGIQAGMGKGHSRSAHAHLHRDGAGSLVNKAFAAILPQAARPPLRFFSMSSRLTTRRRGKADAAKRPAFRLPPAMSAT